MNYDQVRAQAEAACRAAQAPATAGPAPAICPLERRVALRNWGRVDPHNLDDYIARCGGYSGLAYCLKLGPEETLARLQKSGLRGRGGGCPTALKWQSCRAAQGDEKYVICNALDSDPEARTARLLMEGDPHSVLEGLLIGAYAAGAAHCFVCLNGADEYQVAIVREALGQMRERGLLGNDILQSGFSCDITLREIAVSPVSGEETALIRALENRQPLPYLRFPDPRFAPPPAGAPPRAGFAPSPGEGFQGMPTVVNSAETLAVVSAIFQEPPVGSGDSADHGEAATGTKIVTVVGDVDHPGTVEVPLGTSMAALLEATQGTPLSELDIKAAQFGGPTGAFFAGASLTTPITYEDLEAAGSLMGSGTLRVIGGRHTCAVHMAQEAMSFLQEHSCGKCAACREGSYQLADMLTDLAEFRAKAEDMALMLALCEAMDRGSICGFGKTGSRPLLSSLKLFAGDFSAHVDNRRCPAKD